jgi:Ca2+-binding EF-hand superfamily protein
LKSSHRPQPPAPAGVSSREQRKSSARKQDINPEIQDMKTIPTTLIGSLAILIAGSAAAKPEGDRPQRPRMGPEMRQKILEQFDKDGDGKLNEDERKAAREAAKARMQDRKGAFIEKWDTDGDGELNEEERAAVKEAMEAKRKEFLDKYDEDGDGKLSEEERKAAHKDILDKYDEDGDGKLSPEERKAAAEDAALPPRPPHRPGAGKGKGGKRGGPGT